VHAARRDQAWWLRGGGVIVPAPSNYNDGNMVIRVDPNEMYMRAGNMKYETLALAKTIETIHTTWKTMKKGWFGSAANEAENFANKWDATLKELFGKGDNHGVLPKMVNMVIQASVNYGDTEDAVVKAFKSFTEALHTPGGSGPPTRDNTPDAPIHEKAGPPS
jgi:uncharacterized protein YukE